MITPADHVVKLRSDWYWLAATPRKPIAEERSTTCFAPSRGLVSGTAAVYRRAPLSLWKRRGGEARAGQSQTSFVKYIVPARTLRAKGARASHGEVGGPFIGNVPRN